MANPEFRRGEREHWRGADRERGRQNESGGQDYDLRDEDFERRGWRPGSDYYGNDPERYERSAKAQGGYGGTQDDDFGRGDFRHGQSYNDRWQDSYRGSGTNYRDRDESGSRSFEGRSEGQFRGRGPRGYRRSDERIREDACECLTQDDRIDASNIEVTVKDCEVTLSGSVNSRDEKRRAEDLIERLSGVKDVNNSLRVIR